MSLIGNGLERWRAPALRVLMILAVSWALPVQAARVGVAQLYELDEVTVVYPSTPEDRTVRNRRSAERRAAFLNRVHGIRTTVVADSELSGELRKTNLLLLGWENRALDGAPGDIPVIQPSVTGHRFLGTLLVGEEQDLMFVHRSPFAPDRLVVFWSRIDGERDRFTVLPFEGSDWLVYTDYLVDSQGMFEADASWPPRRNPGAEMDFTTQSRRPPLRAESEHFRLHFWGSTIDDEEAGRILTTREQALASAAGFLGPPPDDFVIELFVYLDDDQKREQSGCTDPAHSIPRRRELHTLRSLASSDSPHEEIHLLADELLGPCYSTAFYEGLSVLGEPRDEDSDLGMFAALMVDQDSIPVVAELVDEEELRAMVKTGVGYTGAGLLMGWLRARTDAATFAGLYVHEDPTPEAIAGALGIPEARLQKDFTSWVRDLGRASAENFRFGKASAEAQRLRAEGDFAGAAKQLRKALRFRPDDRATLYKLGLAQIDHGDYRGAETTLARLTRLEFSGADTRYHTFGYYQLGRTFDLRGRRDEAILQYRKMLELPDEFRAHAMAREAIESPPAGSN